MGVLVADVLDRARDRLNDPDDNTWSLDEKIRHLNAGQNLIVDLKPEANTVREVVTLAAGSRQSLPAADSRGRGAPKRFLRLSRNMGADGATPGDPVFYADRGILDRFRPRWRSETGKRKVECYLFDPYDETSYEVYPPVRSGETVQVEVEYVKFPVDVALSTDKPPYVAGEDQIGINAPFEEALVEYIIWQCFAKDEEAASLQLAREAQATFHRLLGFKQEADILAHPATRRDAYTDRPPREDTTSV